MSIVINGIKMPEAPDGIIYIMISGDGTVTQTGESWRSPEDSKYYYAPTAPEKFGNAVSVPEHGDLIDRDALVHDLDYDVEIIQRALDETMDFVGKERERVEFDKDCKQYCMRYLSNAPAIIPAELTKEKTEDHKE